MFCLSPDAHVEGCLSMTGCTSPGDCLCSVCPQVSVPVYFPKCRQKADFSGCNASSQGRNVTRRELAVLWSSNPGYKN